MGRFRLIHYAALWLFLVGAATPTLAATITIINSDSSSEGFNDATAFDPVGGNTATTLGQARLNALQYAANLASQYIVSNVVIVIDAQMNGLGGNGSSATLATAGPTSVLSDFGSGDASTWYPVALAEALENRNINGSYDIIATFNSDVDNQTVLGTTDWYYGLDGDAGSDNDFVTVALHEILHGLGFLTVMDDSTGAMSDGLPDVFLNNLEDHGEMTSDFPSMNDSQRLAAITDTNNLHWTGTNVASNSGSLSGGRSGTHVYMYAPDPLESGSSVSHFSDAVTPNEVMEPYYTDPDHSPGLAVYVLQDIGWTINTGSGSADLHLALSDSGNLQATVDATFTLTITNNGSNTAVESTVTYMMPGNDSYQSFSATQGSCSHANQIVTCSLGDLTAGSSSTVNLVIQPGSSTTSTHAAIVSSATTEANATDNMVSNAVTPAEAPPPSPSSSGGGCFIATAAWGSIFTHEVTTLRRFRDRFLLTNHPGQWFVTKYYQYSPPIADRIKKNEILRAIMRGSLGPLLAFSRFLTRDEKPGEKNQPD